MTDITIKQISKNIGISVESLIKRLSEIGIKKKVSDSINKFEKERLLNYISNQSGSTVDQFFFQRKVHTTLNVCNENGENKSIKVEVRKKHVYSKEILHIKSNEQVKKQKNEYFTPLLKQNIHNEINKNKFDYTKYEFNQYEGKNYVQSSIDESNKSITDREKLLIKKNKDLPNMEKNLSKKEIKKKCYLKNKKNFISHSKEFEKEKVFTQFPYIGNIISKKNKNKMNSRNIKQKKISAFDSKSLRKEENIYFDQINKRKKISLSVKHKFQYTEVNRTISIGETISVSELANKLAIKSAVLIKEFMKIGMVVTINQIIDQETAQLISEELGHTVILRHKKNELEQSLISNKNPINISKLEKRAPIVTIMGHVNHGKTSLLDKIRASNITNKEIGNITQNIGAYHVITKSGSITLIDTPGHSAFSKMRSISICITDIMILVVSIDDGVMPQTIESINHAQLNKIPIIVAINKIDKNVQESNHIKNELSKYGIISEEWGGENQFVYISAKHGIGIDTLIDAVLLQSEILELKANKNTLAKGTVIDSFLDKNLGPTATVLVKDGTLKKSDIVLCGCEYGKIRSMQNEFKKEIFSAGPSIPVKISGLSGILIPGEEIISVNNERKAREISHIRKEQFREIRLENQHNKSKKLFHILNNNVKREINILLKSYTRGSIDPIKNAIEDTSTEEIKVKVISSGVGWITESDAVFSLSFNAIIIGFNVKIDLSAQKTIENSKLICKNYLTIYDLTNDIKKIVKDITNIKSTENTLGLAEVKNIFHITNTKIVIGCLVIQGKIKRNNKIKILRNKNIIYDGKIESLRRFKHDVNEVQNGMECGIGIKNYIDVCNGDIIKSYEHKSD